LQEEHRCAIITSVIATRNNHSLHSWPSLRDTMASAYSICIISQNENMLNQIIKKCANSRQG